MEPAHLNNPQTLDVTVSLQHDSSIALVVATTTDSLRATLDRSQARALHAALGELLDKHELQVGAKQV